MAVMTMQEELKAVPYACQNYHHPIYNLIYNKSDGLNVYVCVYTGIVESLLLLNALTDLHQICSEGQTT